MKIPMRYVFTTVLLMFSSTLAWAQEPLKVLTIEADDWCPVNCPPNQHPLGIGVDLVKKVFEPLGYTINYVIVPWEQALKDVREGKIDAVIGASSSDDPTLVFPKHPVVSISDDFYVLKGNPWRYQGAYTLKGKRIGVITNYGYGDVVKKYIEANKNERDVITYASGNEAVKKNITNLLDGKTQVLVESKLVMDYWLSKLNLQDKVDLAGGVPQDSVYVAFSPALPASKEHKREYDDAINKLASTQELAAMYRAYGISPP